MPRVSVILNSYNQRRWLPEAITSVLGQTFDDWELIAMDNGSTDGSPELIRDFADKDPRIVAVLNKDNRPISQRFNEGVARATGQFLCFLYSDDYYLPHKLDHQVQLFEGLGADYGVVYAPVRRENALTGRSWQQGSFGASGYVLREIFTDYHLGTMDMISPLTRRECFARYRFHDDVFAEGEAYFFRVAMKYKFAYDAKAVAVSRDTGLNAGKATRKNVEMTAVCLDRLERDPDFPREYARYVDEFRGRWLRDSAWSTVRTGGDVAWAREMYWRSVRMRPSGAFHPRTVAGVALSFVPSAARATLNRIGTALRRDPGNAVHVAGYH